MPASRTRLHLAADEVGQRRPVAAVGNVRDLRAHRRREDLRRDVRARAVARRSEAQRLAALHEGDEAGQVVGGHRGVHEQNAGGVRHHDQRLERARLVRQVGHHELAGDEAEAREQQRVAVGRSARDGGGADRRAAAGAVVDQHRLVPLSLRRLASPRASASVRPPAA